MQKKFELTSKWDRYKNALSCLNNVSGMTIFLFSDKGELQSVFSDNPTALELYRAAEQRLIKILNGVVTGIPSFLSEAHGTSFFAVKAKLGILLFGPVLHMSIKESAYYEQFEHSKLSVSEKIRYAESFAYTPVIDYKRFVELALVINNFINGKDVSIGELVEKRELFYYSEPEEPFEYNRERYAKARFPVDIQEKLIEAVRSGDANAVTVVVNSIGNWNFNFAADTPIRGYKLTFAAFCGVIMSNCIRAELDRDLSIRLCEYYIDWIERSKTVEDIIGVFLKMLYDYTERFYVKNNSGRSKLSVEFEKYIYDKINYRISLDEAAEHLEITPQHLCKVIKADFGITPNKFIQQIKIGEAKKLLRAGEIPLSDIWLHLGYCDQSHFSKVFKENTGITPSGYITKSLLG